MVYCIVIQPSSIKQPGDKTPYRFQLDIYLIVIKSSHSQHLESVILLCSRSYDRSNTHKDEELAAALRSYILMREQKQSGDNSEYSQLHVHCHS